MTNTVALETIRLLLDKADAPYFTDAEIQTFIELATHDFVEQNYSRFETNQESRDNLRTLVVEDTTSITSDTVAYPADFRYFLSANVTINNISYSLKFYQIDDVDATINDPFNRASATNPILVSQGNTLRIIGAVPASGVLRYLQNPTMDTTAGNQINDLPQHTHFETVNIAARKMLANIDASKQFYAAQAGETAAQNR
tara:strand:- start:3261 stop:3857 length:597 start_codon:yes stop_codon:yes gene_type:complete